VEWKDKLKSNRSERMDNDIILSNKIYVLMDQQQPFFFGGAVGLSFPGAVLPPAPVLVLGLTCTLDLI
jgi:hypothetical protein